MRAKGLTQREIADTAGVSDATVRRDLAAQPTNVGSEPITNSRGQQRPATYSRPDLEDVIDAVVGATDRSGVQL